VTIARVIDSFHFDEAIGTKLDIRYITKEREMGLDINESYDITQAG